MKTKNHIFSTSNKNFLWLILLFIISFLFLPNVSSATSGGYGWFTSTVEYVDNTLPSGCDAGTRASVEVILVDGNTKNPVSSIGTWRLNVRNSAGVNINQIIRNGQTSSGRVCFDPVNNGLQVVVGDSTEYHPHTSATIYPQPADNLSNSQKVGSHFVAYVHLARKTSTPDVVAECVSVDGSICSSGNMVNTDTPSFIFTNNNTNTIYSSDQLSKVKIYIQDSATNPNLTTIDLTPAESAACSNRTCSISVSSPLDEGHYTWTLHQDLNGLASTTRFSSPAYAWLFSNIPSSAIPNSSSFTIDTTPPLSVFKNFTLTNVSGGTATLSFQSSTSDAYSLVTSNDIEVLDSGGTPVFSGSYNLLVTDVSVPVLSLGETYTLRSTVTDAAGNYRTYSEEYTVPLDLNVPEVSLYSGRAPSIIDVSNGVQQPLHPTTNLVMGIVTDINTNPLLPNGMRVCWSTSTDSYIDDFLSTNIIPEGLYCLTVENYTENNAVVTSPHNYGVPKFFPSSKFTITTRPEETIYFIIGARNVAGWGYSPVGTYTTPFNPFIESITCPLATPAVREYGPFGNITLGLEITSAGCSRITNFGICIFTDKTNRDNFTLDLNNVPSNCKRVSVNNIPGYQDGYWYNGQPVTSLPYRSNWFVFNNLVAGTTHYFKLFTTNEVGFTGYGDYQRATAEATYDFGFSISPAVSWDSTDFNPVTRTYNKIKVRWDIGDWSTILTPNKKVRTTVKIDKDNNGTYDYTEDIEQISSDSFREVELSDVPLGKVKVRVFVNDPDSVHADETDSDGLRFYKEELGNRLTSGNVNERIEAPTITPPAGFEDSTETGSETSGTGIDPEIQLTATPSIIRTGRTSIINWSTLDIDVDCTLNPGNHTFNSQMDGTLDVVANRRSGQIVLSSPINNTQLFTLTCDNGAGSVHSESIRVTAIGNSIEI